LHPLESAAFSRRTPISDIKLWEMSDMVKVLEDWEAGKN
jgi:hypothetical protein